MRYLVDPYRPLPRKVHMLALGLTRPLCGVRLAYPLRLVDQLPEGDLCQRCLAVATRSFRIAA